MPLPRALGTMPGHQDQEWPLRRLGVVFTWQPAAPTPLRSAPGPSNSPATGLANPVWHRLEEIQRLADAGTAGDLYRCGGEVPEPATPGPIGSADRPAVFDSGGIRGKCGGKGAECRDHHKSPANKGDFAIHLGYTPEYVRSITGHCPSGHRAWEQAGRQQAKWGTQQIQGKGHLGSAASAEGYATQRGELPEYYPGSVVEGSP